MRRFALTTCAIASLFTVSGCGIPAVLEALPASKDDSATQTTQAPSSEPTSERAKTKSTEKRTTSKPAASKSSTAKSTAAKSSEEPQTVEIPEEQKKILRDALVPIIKEYAENPETDTVSGQIRFDKNMKPINFSKFTVNDKPIGIDGPVRRDAEKALAPLADIPESERFSKLEFKYANNYLESTVHYRD